MTISATTIFKLLLAVYGSYYLGYGLGYNEGVADSTYTIQHESISIKGSTSLALHQCMEDLEINREFNIYYAQYNYGEY